MRKKTGITALFCGSQTELVLESLWESQRLKNVLIVCSLVGAAVCFAAMIGLRLLPTIPRTWDTAISFAGTYTNDTSNLEAKLLLRMDMFFSLLLVGLLVCIFLLCCLFAKKIAAALENPRFARLVTSCAWGVTAALLCYVTALSYLYGKQWLNSDASSDGLVLGKVLAEENVFVTDTWYYSTELRLIFQTLFTMPLFKLLGWTGNWSLIRAINIFLNNTTLILAYTFMMRQLKIKWLWIAITAALFLLPLEEGAGGLSSYWDMVTFAGVYVFFLIQMFVCLGLLFHLLTYAEATKKNVLFFVLFSVLSFVLGVQGIRSLLVIQLPLVLAAFAEFAADRPPRRKWNLTLAIWNLILGTLGFALSEVYLRRVFNVGTFVKTGFLDLYNDFFTQAGRIANNTMIFYGWKSTAVVLSGEGIFNAAAMVFTALLFYTAIKTVRLDVPQKHTEEEKNTPPIPNLSPPQKSLVFFFLFCTAFNCWVLWFTNSEFNQRYFIPFLVLYIPLIALFFEKALCRFSRRVYVAICSALLLFFMGQGILNFCKLPEIDVNRHRQGYISWLTAHNLGFGFATRWNANVTTELTDGKIVTVPIAAAHEKDGQTFDGFHFMKFLNQKKYENPLYHSGEAFLLLEKDEYRLAEESQFPLRRPPDYEDEQFVIIRYPDEVRIFDEVLPASHRP